MKKKILFLIPALLGMFLSSCGGGGGGNPPVTQYTITFKDEVGQTLESKKWNEGVVPSYNYVKEDTAEWDYTVDGWSLTQGGAVITIPAASADATYFAIVSQVKRSYKITFYNEKDQEIKSETLEYGVQPACDYTGPVDTEEWDYTFKGWATTKNGAVLTEIPTVTGAANYYAVVQQEHKKYQIRFYKENGDLISNNNVEYGAQPVCNYTGPADTAEWDYTFKGWATTQGGTVLAAIPTVTGAADYYAVVQQVKNKYTITFESNGGTSVASITEDYGTSINEPAKPSKDNHKFVAWTTDAAGNNPVTWPYTITSNIKFYAQWNEVVDIKTYLQTLISVVGHDPYSYIPATMQPDNSANHVTAASVNYDFTQFTNVSGINYGGFGEQWHMVIENIKESERFYSVLSIGEAAINASVALFNNYLDNNPGTTATHTLNETAYTAKIDYHSGVLAYTIQYKTNFTIPFFGEVMPQVDMTYDITSLEKAVRIQLTENNAMRYVVKDNSYSFGVEYGVSTVSRKAYFQINRLENESVQGHIYEFVQYKDKDLVPSCADFYIDDTYTSVVGNKASGIPGFAGYINELYETEHGRLIGYKVRETFTKWGFEKTYNTLWFNLNNITGINSVKAIANDSIDPHENNHDIYLNGSSSIFEPTKNKVAIVETSRRYDVEMRKQYFYGYNEGTFTEYEVQLPMMFIQDNGDKSGETNYSTFESDISSKSGINASVNLANKYLAKIRADYLSLIDVFIRNKELVTGDTITAYIGNAIVIR